MVKPRDIAGEREEEEEERRMVKPRHFAREQEEEEERRMVKPRDFAGEREEEEEERRRRKKKKKEEAQGSADGPSLHTSPPAPPDISHTTHTSYGKSR